jgi:hypothetical protein
MKILREKKLSGGFTKVFLIVVLMMGSLLIIASFTDLLKAVKLPPEPLPVWEVENPISTVFVMDSLPLTSGSLATGDNTVPDEYLIDPAIDSLLLMMETKDIFLHQTVSHRSGIVGSNNVVIIKGNFQWTSRNTTSTDRIKGLIWQILQHPEGFNGEILVCDNTQKIGTGINQGDNNSEDPQQSIIDVVNTFQSKGYPVYYLDWNYVWSVVAEEYSAGDNSDGFVYEPASKISYPKFLSPSGNYQISMRYGIWNSSSQKYNSGRLCIIDFPVLKAHSMAGSTIAVKNWIGVLTTAHAISRYGNWDTMHHQYFFGQYALVARVMSETYPKLTIVDAAWTSTRDPNDLSDVVNTNMLLGSTDPCAVSWYTAKFILTPIAIRPYETDPDRPNSNYHYNLEAWTNCLQDSGFSCTMDSVDMSIYDRNVLSATSVNEYKETRLNPTFQLYQNYPNPFNSNTTIIFDLMQPENLSLNIYDITGRLVKTLIDDEMWEAGHYSVQWNGKDEHSKEVSSGVYFYKMEAGNFNKTKTMINQK